MCAIRVLASETEWSWSWQGAEQRGRAGEGRRCKTSAREAHGNDSHLRPTEDAPPGCPPANIHDGSRRRTRPHRLLLIQRSRPEKAIWTPNGLVETAFFQVFRSICL